MALQSCTLDLGTVKFTTVDLASNVQSMRGRVLKKSKPQCLASSTPDDPQNSIKIHVFFLALL